MGFCFRSKWTYSRTFTPQKPLFFRTCRWYTWEMWRGWQNSLGPQGKVVRQVFPMSKKVVLGMSLKNLKLVTMETCHFVKKNWWFKFRFMEFSHQHLSLMQVRSLDAPTCDQPGILCMIAYNAPIETLGKFARKNSGPMTIFCCIPGRKIRV